METDKNNKSDAKENNSGQQQGFDLSGLDLSGILPPGTWDIVKPLLPGGITALGMYFFIVKPIKEKVETMSTKMEEMQKRLDAQKEYILSMETKQEEIVKDLGSLNDELEKKDGLFETRRRSSSSHSSSSQSSGTNDFRKRGLNL